MFFKISIQVKGSLKLPVILFNGIPNIGAICVVAIWKPAPVVNPVIKEVDINVVTIPSRKKLMTIMIIPFSRTSLVATPTWVAVA